MAESPRSTGKRAEPANSGSTGGQSAARPPKTPRWVWMFLIGVGVLALLVVLAMTLLGGGGEHGPSRHTPPQGSNHGMAVSVTAVSAVAPGGHM